MFVQPGVNLAVVSPPVVVVEVVVPTLWFSLYHLAVAVTYIYPGVVELALPTQHFRGLVIWF